MARAPFDIVNQRANEICELIHSDVCGPMSIVARGGYSYFITYTDNMLRYEFVYLMKHNYEAF